MIDVIDLIDQLAIDLQRMPSVIPLQRRIRASSALFAAILEQGYPIKALAEALASRGVVTRGGGPISYGHLRVLLARLSPVTKPTRVSPTVPAYRPAATGAIQLPPRHARQHRPDFSGGLFGDRFTQPEKSRD